MGACAFVPVPIVADASSIMMLMEGIRQLGLAIQEVKEFQADKNVAKKCAVEFTLKTQEGLEIGLAKTENNELQFVVQEEKKKEAIETINKVKQVYAKLKITNELKKKGYQGVKEEKLADGSVRLVLQKWR